MDANGEVQNVGFQLASFSKFAHGGGCNVRRHPHLDTNVCSR